MSDREDTFLELISQNQTRLRKICRAYARDAEAASDLYQDILVQVWRSLPLFEGEARPDTWLYRVALNTALSDQRKQRVRREAALDPAHPLRPARPPQPDERLQRDERLERLYAAIDRLNRVDRALVMLYLDERSYREISQVLGISESAVGVKLHRIKKKLAGWLAEASSCP